MRSIILKYDKIVKYLPYYLKKLIKLDCNGTK